ncbi:MAG TPA: hypothetical protein VJQ55_12070, partial [Candidatus Binatia bacterium]|nr:hypothetical protein [Candidatus Binatia bacterium]
MIATKATTADKFSISNAAPYNVALGWCLLLFALVSPAFLALSHAPAGVVFALLEEQRAFEARTMIALLGIWLLALSPILRQYCLPSEKQAVVCLIAWGSLFCAAGYACSSRSSATVWLIVLGAIVNLAVWIELVKRVWTQRASYGRRIALAMIFFGLLLITATALAQIHAEVFQFTLLGAEDGFTWRTLRLARVAAIALPLLTLFYEEVADFDRVPRRLAAFGYLMMLCGTFAMATLLVGAGVILPELKTLLAIPSIATFIAVLCGFVLARMHASRLETWGWLLIALSLAAGLLMGLYAFADGWLTLDYPGEYSDYARRVIRFAHADCVVIGFAAILAARTPGVENTRLLRASAQLLLLGGIVTIAAPLFILLAHGASVLSSVGPALATAAILLYLAAKYRWP